MAEEGSKQDSKKNKTSATYVGLQTATFLVFKGTVWTIVYFDCSMKSIMNYFEILTQIVVRQNIFMKGTDEVPVTLQNIE